MPVTSSGGRVSRSMDIGPSLCTTIGICHRVCVKAGGSMKEQSIINVELIIYRTNIMIIFKVALYFVMQRSLQLIL